MTSFFAGLFRRAAATRATPANSSQQQRPLPVQQPELRRQCAVEVSQDGNFIIIAGDPDIGSLYIQHEQGAPSQPYDDQIVVAWTTGGARESKAFDLYKFEDRGGQRWPVKNVEYVEFSGGRGKNKFWSQAKISS